MEALFNKKETDSVSSLAEPVHSENKQTEAFSEDH
jgi:hypothetical protein